MSPDRARFIIGRNESTQYHRVIDLDGDRPDDPLVHHVDHEQPSGGEPNAPIRLSRLRATLRVR